MLWNPVKGGWIKCDMYHQVAMRVRISDVITAPRVKENTRGKCQSVSKASNDNLASTYIYEVLNHSVSHHYQEDNYQESTQCKLR